MRNVLFAGMAVLGLAFMAAPAQAQTANLLQSGHSLTNFSAGAAQTIVNTPIDTTQAVAPFPGQNGSGLSALTNFFHSFSLPSWSPSTVGTSALPSPDSFPSTHYENFKPVPSSKPNNPQARRFIPIHLFDN